MKVPFRFEDITLSQFMKLHELEGDKSIEKLDKDTKVLSILTNESIDTIEDLEFSKRIELLSKCTYVKNVPKDLKVVKRFRVNSILLVPTTSLQEMKVNQLCDFYTILNNANGNAISVANDLLAIMFKPFSIIGNSKYSPENHAKISKLLLSAKVGDCLGLLFFYLDLWKLCEPLIVDCLKNQTQTIAELMKEIENDKEFQAFLVNGDGNTM